MKANELSCKDLIVGDWVIPHIFDSKLEPSKIIGIHYNSYKGKDYVDWVDCEVWDELSLNDIEPIPLTAEILEKNGWKHEFDKTDYMVKYNLGEEGKDCWMMWAIKEHNLDIQRQDEKLDMYNLKVSKVVIPCDYVHQIQHAFSLVGINKDFIL